MFVISSCQTQFDISDAMWNELINKNLYFESAHQNMNAFLKSNNIPIALLHFGEVKDKKFRNLLQETNEHSCVLFLFGRRQLTCPLPPELFYS